MKLNHNDENEHPRIRNTSCILCVVTITLEGTTQNIMAVFISFSCTLTCAYKQLWGQTKINLFQLVRNPRPSHLVQVV